MISWLLLDQITAVTCIHSSLPLSHAYQPHSSHMGKAAVPTFLTQRHPLRVRNIHSGLLNTPQFEDKICKNQRPDPKFSFLNPADPYHAYYRQKMDKIAQGNLGDDVTLENAKDEGNTEAVAVVDIGQEPPAPEFIMDLPNISSIDL